VLHFGAATNGVGAMGQNAWIANSDKPKLFKASRIWEFNVWGAMIGGIGGGLVLLVIAAILIFNSESPAGKLEGMILGLTIVATLLALFPGNLITTIPVAVELESGKGLYLVAPLKKLYIPMEEVREARDFFSAWTPTPGTVVKLSKRHGLLKSFSIHWAFGEEGRLLAQAIQREIFLRG